MSGLTGMPERMDAQAELTTLRWVAIHLVESHDRHQAQLAEAYPELALPKTCGCPLCRQARPWVEIRAPQQPAGFVRNPDPCAPPWERDKWPK